MLKDTAENVRWRFVLFMTSHRYRVLTTAVVGHRVEAGAVVVIRRQSRTVLHADADAFVIRVDLVLVELVGVAAFLLTQQLLNC